MQENSSSESTAVTKISSSPSKEVSPQPSRVDVIPSVGSLQKKPCEELLRGTMTVLKKPEYDLQHKRTHPLSVFSGPHFQADQYQIKPDLHTPHPDKYSPVKSRYYVPHLYQYFQAALQNTSRFEVHSDYTSSDPINFRHAYRLNHSHDTHLNGHAVHRMSSSDHAFMHDTMVIPSKRSFTEYQQPNEPRPVEAIILSPVADSTTQPQSLEPSVISPPLQNTSRKWHRVASPASEASTTSSALEDAALLTALSRGKEKQVTSEAENVTLQDQISNSSNATSAEYQTDNSDQEYELEDDATPPPLPQPIIPKGRPKGRPKTKGLATTEPSPAKSPKSRPVSSEVPVSTPSETPVSLETQPTQNPKADSQPPKPHTVPDQPAAIERIRRFGKFVYTWRIRQQPEVCCICFGDEEKEPIVGCDNPMCDVRLHASCYQKTKEPGAKMTRRWVCDKCTYLRSLSTSIGIACALCPNTSGVFCMLDPKKYTIPWVHYNCAKTFLGEDGIVFNTEYYEAQLDVIPSSHFEQICADCTKPSYAQYGAKIPCRLCDKYYHVTCTEQYYLAIQGEPYECLDHTSTTKKDTEFSRKRRLAVAYHRWVGRRNQHLFEEFSKVPRMLTLDLWKSIDLSKLSMGKLTGHYQRSLAIIQNNESYPIENTLYSQWVNYILALFTSLYSAHDMERNRAIFTLKGYQVDIGYDFKPTKDYASSPLLATPYTLPSIMTSKKKSQKSKLHTPAAVMPSEDLVCAICLAHDLPAQVWERHHLDDAYKTKLIQTQDQRKPGYTGTGSHWDPQVFIRCCRCETIVHCGCPQPPIKAYPQKFRVFICIRCDIKHEQAARDQVNLNTTARRSHQVNYKE